MIGVSGSLLSNEAFEQVIRDRLGPILDGAGSERARHPIRAWHARLRAQIGPTASPRTIFDRLAAPLFAQIGYRVLPSGGALDLVKAVLEVRGSPAAALIVTGWGRDPGSAWREAVRQGIGLDVRWCVCATGPVLRVVDARRTYSRRFVEFELQGALDDQRAFEMLWGLLRADAMAPRGGDEPALDRAIALTEEHRARIRDALQEGVHDAVSCLSLALVRAMGRKRAAGRESGIAHVRSFEESLTLVYRILFLLFAEARGLVPRWHPIFRDAYTIESLREPVELFPRPRGLWESLQAIARLAHRGCHLGALTVPPFNGRLFAPAHAPLSDSLPLDDAAVRRAVLALTTRAVRGSGRVRVSYGDLGVEQLGGIYERLLDFSPSSISKHADVPGEARKSSGSFYTPRSLTEFVVRRTLSPLVRDASPEQILGLRVLDPAMGSGAFLVAACRYLASAYEAAIVREGGFAAADITETERTGFRRAVAQQCLFGVDLNPTAVQLGRLSLWLATLASDRPLTFLDHRLRVGNSLVGARIDDLLRQPSSARCRGAGSLPLFDADRIGGALEQAIGVRLAVAAEPDDTLDQVRKKERALARLGDASEMARWKDVADLWCAEWFGVAKQGTRRQATFAALSDAILGKHVALPPHVAAPLLERARTIAREQRFFHWTLEFPEVFHQPDGQPLPDGGFDAIIGNPPWEMLRGDRGSAAGRRAAHDSAALLTAFARSSGVYHFQRGGHANLYQLFLERVLMLVRPAGRIGMILPSGFAVDQGSSELRRALLERTAVDGLISVENRDGVFPIHRSLKFLLVTATRGGPTSDLHCRFGVRAAATLDRLPDAGFDGSEVTLPRALLAELGGPGLSVPELRTKMDVEIVSRILFHCRALGSPEGWHVRFGRELNATDDRGRLASASTTPRGLPVIEGKHVSPFAIDAGAASLVVPPETARRLIARGHAFDRPRLAYRDVASATNRLSLIAAIVPAGVATTHTVFCLKEPLDQETQHFLCGIFNSFVANYLIRTGIGTHIGAAVIARLPVPKPARHAAHFKALAALSAALSRGCVERTASRAQAVAALLYRVDREQFSHILDTFPLVPEQERAAAMDAFCDIVT